MKADVVVIGAGALGLSAALHLAMSGRSVVIVERDEPGAHASGRAAGLFKSVQADALRTDLARRSITKALTFGDWAGVPLDVIRSGSYLVARTEAHKDFLRTEQRQSRGWGVDIRDAASDEVAGKVSYYHGGRTDFALWCPEDVYIAEPGDLVRAYVQACGLQGADLLEHEQVTGVTLSAGRIAGVETTRRSISTAMVVDAAGAWTRQVAALAGGSVAIAPVRHQLFITEPVPGDQISQADPIVRIVDAAVYLRPARGGLMLGGFERGPLALDASEPPFDVPLDLGVLRDLAAQVGHEVPAGSGPVAEHRGGMFTMSPDGRFVTGPVPAVPGLWVASGCNGSGFSSSLALGEALAGWLTGTSAALRSLSPARFGQLSAEVLVRDGVWQYEHYYDPATASAAPGSPATGSPATGSSPSGAAP